MDLDTSSFWVLDYRWGGSGAFQGERVCHVTGDTLYNGKIYKKIKCYTSVATNSSSVYAFGLYTDRTYIFREDTATRSIQIDNMMDKIEFARNVGDTLFPHGTYTYGEPIDSIKYIQYNNIVRRTQFSRQSISSVFKTIEGVGASHSFPEAAWGEWQTPLVTCKCYSKGGQVLYKNSQFFPQDSCYKKARALAWPNGLAESLSNGLDIIYANNTLQINNNIGQTSLRIFTPQGQLAFRKKIIESSFETSFSNLPKGIYILSVQSSKGINNRKILIQ